MFEKEADKYAFEAAMYDQLACYYKYSNPQKHMEFYMKHLDAVQKLVHAYNQGRNTGQPQPPQIHPAKVRLLHVSPDAPAVDIYMNGQRVLQNISFKQFSDYVTVPQGQYRVDVYLTGTAEAPVLSALIPVMSRMAYTVAVGGEVSKLQVIPYADSTYLGYGKTKVRFIHLSPDAPAVDAAIKGGDVLFPNVSFKQAAEYMTFTPGTVDLEVRAAGTNNVVLALPNTKLDENKVYTVYAVGFTGKEPKLEALFLTN